MKVTFRHTYKGDERSASVGFPIWQLFVFPIRTARMILAARQVVRLPETGIDAFVQQIKEQVERQGGHVEVTETKP